MPANTMKCAKIVIYMIEILSCSQLKFDNVCLGVAKFDKSDLGYPCLMSVYMSMSLS